MPKIIPVQYLEDLRKKVHSINKTNTEEQYPSAKAVYDATSAIDNFYRDLDPINKLNFYNPSLIDVKYMKTVSGWGVQFGEDKVSSNTNQWFSGDTGTTEYKEIEFVPTGNYVDLIFQTPETKHNNSCLIRNLYVSRVDGQPMTLGAYRTEPFSELMTLFSDDFNYSTKLTDNGWTVNWSLATLVADGGEGGTTGVKLSQSGWNGMMNRTFAVTPGVSYSVKMKLKVVSNGVNVKVCDGNSTKATTLSSKYVSGTSWNELTLTAVPTGNYITVNFGGSGKKDESGAYTKDEVYLDNFSITYTTSGLVPWENITLNTNSSKNKDTKTIYINGDSAKSWGHYVTFPLSNLDTSKYYTLRFKADISAGGINFTGSNVEFATKSYIGKSGEHFATFRPTSSSGTIILQGSGAEGVIDRVVVSDIHIYNSSEVLGILNEGNPRCIVQDYGTYDGNSVILNAQGKAYTTCLQIPNIEVVPGVKYKLNFTAVYTDTKTYNWMPYITFTDEDKVAFVTDSCEPSEVLNMGGPWTGPITDELYRLKISIDIPKDNILLCPKFTPKLLEFSYDTTSPVTLRAMITLSDITGTKTEEFEWSGTSDNPNGNIPMVQTAIIPIMSRNFPGLVGGVEILFKPEVDQNMVSDDTKTRQYITRLAMYGDRDTYTDTSNKVFINTPNKEAQFVKRIFAPEFIGNMDDGCVD